MAKRTVTTTEFTDDLDGGAAARTVTFSFDDADYEIDLSEAHTAAFADAVALYVAHARKVRGPGPKRRTAGRDDIAEVRAWAAANGHDVAPRGRISADVLEAYDASRRRVRPVSD